MSYRADARPVEIIRALLDMLPKDVDSLDIAEQRVARVLSSGMWGRACARMLPVVRAAAAYIEAGDKAREWNTVTNRDGRLGPHALPPTREHDALRAAVRAYLEAAGADA